MVPGWLSPQSKHRTARYKRMVAKNAGRKERNKTERQNKRLGRTK